MKNTLPNYPTILQVLDSEQFVDNTESEDIEGQADYYASLTLLTFKRIQQTAGQNLDIGLAVELTKAASNFAISNSIDQLTSRLDKGIDLGVENAGLENGLDNISIALTSLYGAIASLKVHPDKVASAGEMRDIVDSGIKAVMDNTEAFKEHPKD